MDKSLNLKFGDTVQFDRQYDAKRRRNDDSIYEGLSGSVMKELVEKFRLVEEEIVAEKGPVALYGLFERDDAHNQWDLIVSASWLNADPNMDLPYVVEKIQKHLLIDDILYLASVVLIVPTMSFARAALREFTVKDAPLFLRDCEINGMDFPRVYLLTADPKAAASLPQPVAA